MVIPNSMSNMNIELIIPNISFNVDVGEDDLTVTGAIIVGGIITYIIANDLTGFGMADD